MFGQSYLQRDAALQAATGAEQCAGRLEYASQVLADLLNRAAALDALGMVWFGLDLDASHHANEPGAGIEADEALRAFAVAAHDFLEGDCAEARIRGRRARLFADVGDDRLDVEIVEAEESLQQIGGALVAPEAEIAGAALALVED